MDPETAAALAGWCTDRLYEAGLDADASFSSFLTPTLGTPEQVCAATNPKHHFQACGAAPCTALVKQQLRAGTTHCTREAAATLAERVDVAVVLCVCLWQARCSRSRVSGVGAAPADWQDAGGRDRAGVHRGGQGRQVGQVPAHAAGAGLLCSCAVCSYGADTPACRCPGKPRPEPSTFWGYRVTVCQAEQSQVGPGAV